MPLPTTGVTLNAINTEFAPGPTVPVYFSSFYRGGANVPAGQATSATDGTAISTSGLIRFGMFRGLTKTAANLPPNGTVYVVMRQQFGAVLTSITFSTNGNVVATGSGTLITDTTPNWYTPLTTSIGNTHWIRFNSFSNNGLGGTGTGDAFNVWHNLGTPRGRDVTTTSAEAHHSFTYEISSSATGSPLLSSGTVNLYGTNTSF